MCCRNTQVRYSDGLHVPSPRSSRCACGQRCRTPCSARTLSFCRCASVETTKRPALPERVVRRPSKLTEISSGSRPRSTGVSQKRVAGDVADHAKGSAVAAFARQTAFVPYPMSLTSGARRVVTYTSEHRTRGLPPPRKKSREICIVFSSSSRVRACATRTYSPPRKCVYVGEKVQRHQTGEKVAVASRARDFSVKTPTPVAVPGRPRSGPRRASGPPVQAASWPPIVSVWYKLSRRPEPLRAAATPLITHTSLAVLPTRTP